MDYKYLIYIVDISFKENEEFPRIEAALDSLEIRTQKTPLLSSLSRHGSTLYNWHQCGILLEELDKIYSKNSDYKEFREMVGECKKRPHSYLVIIGD